MNVLDQIIFWSAAIVSVMATVMVLLSRNPFYAVLYLILSLFGISMIFYTLGAPFLAALEIIVYAGAIMVLFLFVVQMLSPASSPANAPDIQRPTGTQLIIPVLLSAILLTATVLSIFRAGALNTVDETHVISARQLGIALFENHFLGVKLASLILLIGTVGGMHLGRAANEDQNTEEETDSVAVR